MLSSIVLSILVLGQNSPKTWQDIKAGDCLTIEELQALSNVKDPMSYAGGTCDEDLALEGVHKQTFDCGLEVETGKWTREITKHDQAGIFWPDPVPCRQSVFQSFQEFNIYALPDDPLLCTAENLSVVVTQTEDFKTRHFSAGQGDIYLPDPFIVTTKWMLPTSQGDYSICDQTSVWLEYTGWGNLKGKITQNDCFSGAERFCKKAKMSADKKNDTICLKFSKIENCPK